MAMKIKTRTLDCYLVGDLFLFLSIIAFAKANLKYSFLSACIGFAFYSLGITVVKSIVHNATNDVLYGMDENDHSKITIVASGQSVSNIDGINCNGIVYKIPDGVQATVTPNGVVIKSVCGNIVYRMMGGKLKNVPDPTWNDLFRIHLA